MSSPDLFNAAAMLCNGTGLLLTILVYKKPDSRTFLHRRSELSGIRRRDMSRHRLAMAGFVTLGAGFVFQLAEQIMR